MVFRTCSIKGCDRTHHANGYCRSHNYRARGDVAKSQRLKLDDKPERRVRAELDWTCEACARRGYISPNYNPNNHKYRAMLCSKCTVLMVFLDAPADVQKKLKALHKRMP